MEYRGHQVFIIHPDEGFRENTVEFLRSQEYEAFGFGDTDPVALDNRRESVVFLFVSSGRIWDCRTLVKSLENDKEDIHLVALTPGDVDVEDCFDASISGTAVELRESILTYLEKTGAQGHRHYVRFGSQNASISTFEFHEDGRRYAGIVHDISVRGMSCTYRPEPDDSDGPRKVREMNLNLPGHRCTVSGRMTSQRKVSGQIIHVFMFEQYIPQETIDDLHDFIYTSLSMKLSVH